MTSENSLGQRSGRASLHWSYGSTLRKSWVSRAFWIVGLWTDCGESWRRLSQMILCQGSVNLVRRRGGGEGKRGKRGGRGERKKEEEEGGRRRQGGGQGWGKWKGGDDRRTEGGERGKTWVEEERGRGGRYRKRARRMGEEERGRKVEG